MTATLPHRRGRGRARDGRRGTEGYALSRRNLLRGAGLLGLGGLVSGCGSALASGVAGTGPPANTLSYWADVPADGGMLRTALPPLSWNMLRIVGDQQEGR